jgi:hypothetical protein
MAAGFGAIATVILRDIDQPTERLRCYSNIIRST